MQPIQVCNTYLLSKTKLVWNSFNLLQQNDVKNKQLVKYKILRCTYVVTRLEYIRTYLQDFVGWTFYWFWSSADLNIRWGIWTLATCKASPCDSRISRQSISKHWLRVLTLVLKATTSRMFSDTKKVKLKFDLKEE